MQGDSGSLLRPLVSDAIAKLTSLCNSEKFDSTNDNNTINKDEQINDVLRVIVSTAVGSTNNNTSFEKRVAVNIVRNISQVSNRKMIPLLSLLGDIAVEPIVEGTQLSYIHIRSCCYSLTYPFYTKKYIIIS